MKVLIGQNVVRQQPQKSSIEKTSNQSQQQCKTKRLAFGSSEPSTLVGIIVLAGVCLGIKHGVDFLFDKVLFPKKSPKAMKKIPKIKIRK